jgi:GTPase SAR1 family protein
MPGKSGEEEVLEAIGAIIVSLVVIFTVYIIVRVIILVVFYIILAVFYAIIYAIISVVCVVILVVCGGIIVGIPIGMRNSLSSWWLENMDRESFNNSTMKQPAYRSYFLVKWIGHFMEVFIITFVSVLERAIQSFEKVSQSKSYFEDAFHTGERYLKGAFYIGKGVGILASGVILIGILGLFQFVLLSIISTLSYVVLGVTYLVDFSYRKLKNWSFICPYCRTKLSLPGFLCPSCNLEHSRLVPSIYGIFKRKCSCGRMLPTTSFNGRDDLETFCPLCGKRLSSTFSRTRPVVISIAGSVGAGKSTFLISLVNIILEKTGALGWSWEIVKASDKELISELKRLEKGEFPTKTVYRKPPAFNIRLITPEGDDYLLYLFDYAGETFDEMHEIAELKEHFYVDAMVIVLDASNLEDSDFVVQSFTQSLQFRKLAMDKVAVVLTKAGNVSPEEYLKEKATNVWNLLHGEDCIKEILFFSSEVDPEERIFYNVFEPVKKLLSESGNKPARELIQKLCNGGKESGGNSNG